MPGHTIDSGKVVGFVIRHRCKIGRNVLTNFLQVGFSEGFDTRRDSLIRQDDDRRTVLSRNVNGFNGRIKTIFDIGGCQDHTRAIAVASKARDV